MGFNTVHTDINKGCKCIGCNLLRSYEKSRGIYFDDHDK